MRTQKTAEGSGKLRILMTLGDITEADRMECGSAARHLAAVKNG